jgi:hypothetical protein
MGRTAEVSRTNRLFRIGWLAALITIAPLLSAFASAAIAGPPFETDDPEPVDCHHLEVDVAQGRQSEPALTGPIWEVDYGPTKNVEVSVGGQPHETEIGSVIRFISETKDRPQIGFLPSATLESNGKVSTFLPLWAQKTLGAWTVFGGGGVSRGSEFTGLAAMRTFRSGSGVGVEFYHESQHNPIVPAAARIGIGYIDQLGPSNAITFWLGRALQPHGTSLLYVGIQTILSPAKRSSNCR